MMAAYVWYIQAISNPLRHRGYVAGNLDGPEMEAIMVRNRRLVSRARAGHHIDVSEFPSEFQRSNPKSNGKLDLPLWTSNFAHVRADVVETLRRFDLGNTVFAPIRITLPDGAGVNEDFSILSVANPRSTIDKDMSEKLYVGHTMRSQLSTDKPVHPSVVALKSALEGPDIWIDPDVLKTVFVNDRLAKALLEQDFGKALQLRRVRVAAAGTSDK